MSALAARLRQLHSVRAPRRTYSSFFSRAPGGGGRHFNAHKPPKQPVVATNDAAKASQDASSPSTAQLQNASANANADETTPTTPNASPPLFSTTTTTPPPPLLADHPRIEFGDLHLHRFFSMHRPLLLLHDPAAILRSPHPSEPLFPNEAPAENEQDNTENPLLDGGLRADADRDAEVARQLTRALTMSRAGAAVSWESTLERLGIHVDSETQAMQAAEWNNEWEDIDSQSGEEIHADSVKRKRRKKMKKHKLRKRRKLTRAKRLKLS